VQQIIAVIFSRKFGSEMVPYQLHSSSNALYEHSLASVAAPATDMVDTNG
jgi:hypothetical protein